MRRHAKLLATCLGFALAPAAFAEVLVVAPTGAPFAQISAAVDAAQSGDVILVKSGSYAGFTIFGKGVSVVADKAANVTITGGIRVEDLGPGLTVVLRRLALPQAPTHEAALAISFCVGAVRVEECGFHGHDGNLPDEGPTAGAFVVFSDDVAFTHCAFIGGAGIPFHPGAGLDAGAAALFVLSSNVALWQSALIGGVGGPGLPGAAGSPGGGGLVLNGGSLALDGSQVTGGKGGLGGPGAASPSPGGQGGPGLSANGTLVRRTASSVLGGAGGAPGAPGGTPGSPGAATALTGGALLDHPGPARDLSVSSPVRAGDTITFKFGVEPCDTLLLLASPATASHWLAAPKATLVPEAPFTLIVLALPCTSGTLTFPAATGPLPAGVASLDVFLQAVHLNHVEGKRMGPFSVLTLLDPTSD
jgi:hypothetical protein